MKIDKINFHKKVSILFLLLFFGFNIISIHTYEYLLKKDFVHTEKCEDCKIIIEEYSSHIFSRLGNGIRDVFVDTVYKTHTSEKHASLLIETLSKGNLFSRPPPTYV